MELGEWKMNKKTVSISLIFLLALSTVVLLISQPVHATTLFQDGQVGSTQETAHDFSAWTTTFGFPTVTAAYPYEGADSFHAAGIGSVVAKKTIAASAIVSVNASYNFAHIPASGTNITLIFVRQVSSNTYGAFATLNNVSNSLYWGLIIIENSVTTYLKEAVASNPVAGNYYNLIVLRDVTNDIERLWVNGTLKISSNMAITTDATEVVVGVSAGEAQDLYFDSVTISDNNIVTLDHFTITAPSPVTAGTSFGSVVATAYNSIGTGAIMTDYTGQVYFTSTDAQAVLPYTVSSKYTFTGGDSGQHTFSGFILKTAGSQTITVTDGAKSATSSSITVATAPLDHIDLTPTTATITAGATQPYTALTYDAYGNFIADVSVSASWQITAGAGGTWAMNVYTSHTAGSWTVTVTYSGKTNTSSLTVNVAAFDSITVTPSSASINSGDSQVFAATGYDAYNNSLGDITGSATWAINASAGGSWAASTYTSTNAGTWIVNATKLGKTGSATLTVTYLTLNVTTVDMAGNALTGTTFYLNGTAYANSTILTSPAFDNGDIYQGNATWQGVTVNATFTVTISGNTTFHIICTAWPYTLNGATWHIATDRSVLTASWSSPQYSLSFGTSTTANTLVFDGNQKPTYILGLNYSLGLDWNDTSGVFSRTIQNTTYSAQVSFESWGIYIDRVDTPISSLTLTGKLLTIQLATNDTGTLQVYSGTWGTPQVTGLSAAYDTNTKMVTGTYTQSISLLILDWTENSNVGPTGQQPPIAFTVIAAAFGATQQNQTRVIIVTFTFSSSSFTVTGVSFQGTGSQWLTPLTSFPATFTRGPEVEANGTIEVKLTIPANAEPGNYTVQAEVYGIDPYGTVQSATAPLSFIVEEKPSGLEEIPGKLEQNLWILIGAVAIVAIVIAALLIRRRR